MLSNRAPSELTRPNYQLATVILVAWSLFALLHAAIAPTAHNADASWYFGATLRIISGHFESSIQGLYSPLLSWALVPFVTLGSLDFYRGFCVLNALAFFSVILGTLKISKKLGLSGAAAAITQLFLGLHLQFWSTQLITADLLSSAVMVWWYFLILDAPQAKRFWQRSVWLGLLLALGYYAKSPELPIGLLTLCVVSIFAVRRNVMSFTKSLLQFSIVALVAIALSLPWIVVLSSRYGEPIITAQTLIGSKIQPSSYQPGDELTPAWKAQVRGTPPEVTPPSRLSRITSYLTNKADRLWTGATLIVFGYGKYYASFTFLPLIVGIWIYGWHMAARRAKNDWSWFVTVLGATVHIGAYLWEWGPYPRYYFAIWPLFYAMFGLGFWELSKERLGRNRIPAWVICYPAGIFFLTYTGLEMHDGWQERKRMIDPIVKSLAKHPVIFNHLAGGQIMGRTRDPVAPAVATLVEREMWTTIDPETELDAAKLRDKLIRRNTNTIIWADEVPPVFLKIAGLEQLSSMTHENKTYSIWQFRR